MLNVCQTILQKQSPLKSKEGGEGNKSMVKCDNLPNTKLAKVVGSKIGS